MKKMNWEDLNQVIQQNKVEAERTILQQKTDLRQIRTRPRDPDEIKILNKLCKDKWESAVQSRKVIILNKQEWYYEFD
jgi:hypothetical protein